ncbi:site-specific integrase [Spongiactinospora sp. TRM90649]|uniref:site-specific integrase n=1 Tax=Spongiactinospora sp. TRM90649 TaxID=3031114 RepID=UPI0023F87D39|nr:site-specific integrase [Spongiactinospora sp. TRM90649]MDF5757380.1 site-specific integrase [Spongiactinospora sp. TRM90649]
MNAPAQLRWLRAVESWPHPRDRALALLPFYAGLRVGDAVALDVPDVRISARKGLLIVYGKGGKIREVPIHPQLRQPLLYWLDERRTWPGAAALLVHHWWTATWGRPVRGSAGASASRARIQAAHGKGHRRAANVRFATRRGTPR